MTSFIGRFHPVFVHLPIGILLLAVYFHFLSRKEKYASLKQATGICLLLGTISAVFSCISGYFLSNTGEYSAALVAQHQWLGIGTTIVSLFAYWVFRKGYSYLNWVMLLVALLLIITGHWGGTLTHGAGYLLGNTSAGNEPDAAATKPIANVPEAVLYTDVVQPLLKSKCYSCHGPNKQKGKLRLDSPEYILKGGKEGLAVVAGNTDESSLVKRIFLPENDNDHMPPKAKPQLTRHEMELLHWWVSSGAAFDKKIKDLPQTEKIKPVLLALQQGVSAQPAINTDVPVTPVEQADETAVKKLKNLDVVITPVAQNSNYLSASFIAAVFTPADLLLLEPLKKQLLWLKLGNTPVNDSAMAVVAKLTGLTRLYLEHTHITDKGLEQLSPLTELQYLNITNTKTTGNGLLALRTLKKLKQVFLYKTNITASGYQNLEKAFPGAKIDTGGYTLPMLATDTQEVKPPKVKL